MDRLKARIDMDRAYIPPRTLASIDRLMAQYRKEKDPFVQRDIKKRIEELYVSVVRRYRTSIPIEEPIERNVVRRIFVDPEIFEILGRASR